MPLPSNCVRRQAAEVADSGKGDGGQTVQELPHAVATERDACADRHALAKLELRDGLAGLADLRLLTGDRGEVVDCTVDQLRVTGSVADTHVDDDLDDTPGICMTLSYANSLLQRRLDLVAVALP